MASRNSSFQKKNTCNKTETKILVQLVEKNQSSIHATTADTSYYGFHTHTHHTHIHTHVYKKRYVSRAAIYKAPENRSPTSRESVEDWLDLLEYLFFGAGRQKKEVKVLDWERGNCRRCVCQCKGITLIFPKKRKKRYCNFSLSLLSYR